VASRVRTFYLARSVYVPAALCDGAIRSSPLRETAHLVGPECAGTPSFTGRTQPPAKHAGLKDPGERKYNGLRDVRENLRLRWRLACIYGRVPIAFSLFIAVAGFALAVIASRWAVSHASQLAYGLAVPPFLIGITIVALGTDGPEIANSIVASFAGHGDLNVGNGIGSVFAQITFVLGLLPFVGTTFSVGSWRSAITPAITVVSLGLGALLIGGGYISRLDGALLVAVWVAGTVLSWRYSPPLSEPEMIVPSRSKTAHAALMLVSLSLVIAGAGAGVEGMLQLSREFGVPEYLLSFFGSSVGTSLPEIVVTVQAVRQGQWDLALGDILGACLLDSSFSVGIGPLLSPTPVTVGLAENGFRLAAGSVAAATLLLWLRRKHDRWSGALLMLLYGAGYWVLLSA
jgi:cation:H+ antiporter